MNICNFLPPSYTDGGPKLNATPVDGASIRRRGEEGVMLHIIQYGTLHASTHEWR